MTRASGKEGDEFGLVLQEKREREKVADWMRSEVEDTGRTRRNCWAWACQGLKWRYGQAPKLPQGFKLVEVRPRDQ